MMPSQKTINIALGIITLVVIGSLVWMGISTNSRLSYLEGKTSK